MQTNPGLPPNVYTCSEVKTILVNNTQKCPIDYQHICCNWDCKKPCTDKYKKDAVGSYLKTQTPEISPWASYLKKLSAFEPLDLRSSLSFKLALPVEQPKASKNFWAWIRTQVDKNYNWHTSTFWAPCNFFSARIYHKQFQHSIISKFYWMNTELKDGWVASILSQLTRDKEAVGSILSDAKSSLREPASEHWFTLLLS